MKCHGKKSMAARSKRYAKMTPEQYKAHLKKAADDRREKYNADPEYRKATLENMRKNRAKSPRMIKNQYLKYTYGITIDRFDEILAEQGGKCAVCGRTEPCGKASWHVDHDHETGRVRGLLCHFCNTAIGALGDSVDVLNRCIRYLSD